uniref:Cadherin domain-containing protein n=1 Tax=Varanus komodoensis TaxID=61221 RepID=A0A8D2JCF9_VARKO
KKVTFNVPHKLEAGMFVGRVNMKPCFTHSGIIHSSNPNFTILEDGSLYTTADIFLSFQENTIINQRAKARHARDTVLRRTKRRWDPVPTSIMENSLGPFPMQIQQFSSDMDLKYNIRYSISGHGVDKPPLNYFYIEQETGNLFVTRPIDREMYPEFKLICYAVALDGYTPEIPLEHMIRIEDDNDNAPVFDRDIYIFHILENSRIGTTVGQVTATDNDEPYTLHTKVKYKLVPQNLQNYQNPWAFVIHPDSGFITVASPDLDREVIFLFHIEARDMGGQEFGLCTTAEVFIGIEDVNDNAPELMQTMYEVQLYENTVNGEILCIPVIDDDEPETASWLATFTIIKGNEDNSFSITIDQKRNVGCLAVLKGLDYEDTKERILEIIVNNEAPYAPYSKAFPTRTAVVVIRIKDQDEAPVFEPSEYVLNIKECLPGGTVVGSYQARDPLTETSGGLRYMGIINNPCDWITIDHKGQLRTTKILDRDAANLEYTQCKVTVSATDQSDRTGTGEIVIKLMDENDNYPVVTRKKYIMCKDKKPVIITAFDADLPPYTIPFHFEIELPMSLTWTITQNEGTLIPSGYFTPINISMVNISDNAGHSGTSEIIVQYCNCVIPSECFEPRPGIPMDHVPLDVPVARSPSEELSNSTLAPWGVAATVLGLLLLLCLMAREVCDNVAFQNLMVSNIEAPGEELMVSNIFQCICYFLKKGQLYFCDTGARFAFFLSIQLVFQCEQDEDHKHDGEYVHRYKYEGKESPVGSLSSCTGQSDEEELDFLNHPEPPFKALVENFVKK